MNSCYDGGLGPGGLCSPLGMAFDGTVFFVADVTANRVLRFNNPLATGSANSIADLVLGQINFSDDGPNIVKSNGFYFPAAIAIDRSALPNRLYVGDKENSRVLGWHNVPAFANGAAADIVIGQPDFLSSNCNQFSATTVAPPAANTLCFPNGVAVDPMGNLYVADLLNNRVLEYNQPFSSRKLSDLTANLVFGQQYSD